MRRTPDGSIADVTPPPFSARTLVHEYGGGAWTVRDGLVVFSNFVDQRLYSQRPGAEPTPLTPEPGVARGERFADAAWLGDWLVCVRESHRPDEVVNEIVAVPLSGGTPILLTGGHDFYAYPRPSPDGTRLCWITWDHPQMPWDGTELWTAPLSTGPDGVPSLGEPVLVVGSSSESVVHPVWGPGGALHYVSDRTGWWNLYAEGDARPIVARDAEFGRPLWQLGTTTYGFLPDGQTLVTWFESGADHIGVADKGQLEEWSTEFTVTTSPSIGSDRIAVMAGGPNVEQSVVTFPINAPRNATVVRRPRTLELADGDVSAAQAIDFPSVGGRVAHAYFYAPRNSNHTGPDGERPPLIVISHGGPTSATPPALTLGIQYWTSRGFAVVDVNYGGSTGYGRAYRDLLQGQWGVVDVEDCIAAARWLADEGHVDGDRLLIRGGSAGGYTTLCALTFHDVFAAGASYYGVADAARLAADTHKFEARYCDGLIGPYPEAADLYRERSPIHSVERLSRPLIIFQGLEDPVVPPSQAEMMVEALAARRIPHAYLAFEGEQHGFRRAETQRRCMEAELYFYSKVLGFPLADEIEPVDIAFLQ